MVWIGVYPATLFDMIEEPVNYVVRKVDPSYFDKSEQLALKGERKAAGGERAAAAPALAGGGAAPSSPLAATQSPLANGVAAK
jgi:hypothetical protein